MLKNKKALIFWGIALFVVLALVVSIIVLINIDPGEDKVKLVESGLKSGPWTYDLYSDKTAVITAYTPADDQGDPAHVTVPKKLGGAKVTGLGTMEDEDNKVAPDGVFYENEDLLSVTLPDTVTFLGVTTFSGCKKLEEVNLPKNLVGIGNSAFYLCYALEKITLPETVTQIDGSAFAFCSALTDITLPKGITVLSAATFEGCGKLKTASLPGVTSVESGAFKGCKQLESVTLSDAVTLIGTRAFKDCTSLTTLTWDGGERLSINEEAFLNCTALQEFTFPVSSYRVYTTAFLGCTALSKIIYNAQSCDVAVADIENPPDAPFSSNPISEIVFSSNVQKVPAYMFSDCEGLTSLSLPEGLLNIGAFAFRNCTGLQEITIPTSVLEIYTCAFGDCTGLKTLNFNAKTCLTLYDDKFGGAFEGCTSLEKLILGSEVKSISANFMRNNEALSTVEFSKDPESVGDRAFQYTAWLNAKTEEYVILGKTLLKYNGDGKNISLPADLECISARAFFGQKELSAITLPETLLTIGDYAFASCPKLSAIALPAKLESLGNGVFRDCEKLEEATLPDDITIVPESAFEGCAALRKITLAKNTTEISKSAFSGCVSLESVSFPNTLTAIGANAFSGCKGLGLITIPAGVSTIGEYAFAGAATEVILGTGLSAFTTSCFGGTWGTDEITTIYFLGTISLYESSLKETKDKIPQAELIPYLSTAPTGDGTFWHYDENQLPVIWEKNN